MMDLELNFPLIDETDDTDEDFLSEVPLSIIENSIENQFNDPLEFRKKDYIQDFITKYNYMKEHPYEFETDGEGLDIFHDDFMKFILNIYEEKLGIGLPDIEDASEEDQHELIHLIYAFFIRKIKKNFVTILCKEIDDNKSSIAESLDRRKDITYNTFKEEIGDEEFAAILSNLDRVIRNILNDIRKSYDVDKFFEMCDYGEVSPERESVVAYYDNFTITGNFIPNYVDMVAHNEFFIIDLETKIRSHILKNFPVRKIDNKELDKVNEEITDEN